MVAVQNLGGAEQAKATKEEGNKLFKEGNYGAAIASYSKALELNPKGGSETAIYYKNRAACYLKIERYESAAKDCSAALDIGANDPKALFRRCQALEAMGRTEDAYKDAMMIVRVDPKNKAVHPILQRLTPVIQQKIEQQTLTDNKVAQMFDLTFKNTDDPEKRLQAANNLIVLARDSAGAERIIKSGGIEELLKLMQSTDKELHVTALRVLSGLATNSQERAFHVLEQVTLNKLILTMAHRDNDISTAAAHCLQNICIWMSDIENIKKERDKYEAARKADSACKLRPFPFVSEKIDTKYLPVLDRIFDTVSNMLNQAKVSAYGRDNAMELIIKLASRKEACGQSVRLIDNGCLNYLLEVAGTIEEHKSLPVTDSSRMHSSLALSKIYDDLFHEKERNQYQEVVDHFFTDLFGDNIMESKVEAIMALSALLQGPFEIGSHILSRTGVLEMIMAMAESENAMHVKYAIEALVQSASKKERCMGVIKEATPLLKQLYQSPNDHIKVRALVGLCKLCSYGGSDASRKSFAEGSSQTLAQACRKFLKNPAKDVDLRKWAAEGLAYLSLDADVKEELTADEEALRSLIQLAKVPDKGVLYPVAQIFVNITCSYDKKEPDAQLIELAKFAKHHVPEENEKDMEPFISQRVTQLVKNGVVNALVLFSKSDSANTRELLSRVFLAITDNVEHRGLVVQQGGAKALLPLASEGTNIGKVKAAHALARIGVTMNPEVAFPGQRMCEVVRPLVSLLTIERDAIENFESLLALTNLASVSDTVRKRILKDSGYSKIEYFAFEEHEQLRRASLECICNLCMCEETMAYFKRQNDRVKFLLLMCAECEEDDDLAAVRASAGALAMLTEDREICGKVITCSKQWVQILQGLAMHVLPDVQHRGCHIIGNVMVADKEMCATIVNTNILDILMAIIQLGEPERAKAAESAQHGIDAAIEFGLIEPTESGKQAIRTKKAQEHAVIQAAREAAEREAEAKAAEEEKKLQAIKDVELDANRQKTIQHAKEMGEMRMKEAAAKKAAEVKKAVEEDVLTVPGQTETGKEKTSEEKAKSAESSSEPSAQSAPDSSTETSDSNTSAPPTNQTESTETSSDSNTVTPPSGQSQTTESPVTGADDSAATSSGSKPEE